MADSRASPGILFTAFEPSGDALAAPLIAALREAVPGTPIYAFGGPRMAEAGATLLESTTDDPAMLLSAARQAWLHRARLSRLKQWLNEHPLALAVPTDSPAANWGVCRSVRRLQPNARIVHLAAPQLWAWGGWRIRKLRRLTDRVLCLLPFEVDWFQARGVPATFVSHPLFAEAPAPTNPSPNDRTIGDPEQPPTTAGDPLLAQSTDGRFTGPRLAILPGSRPAEVQHNWPGQLEVFHRLRAEHPRLRAVVAAADRTRAGQIRELCPEGLLPRGMRLTVGQTSSVLRWAEAVLVVSGTASLQCVVHRVPMVIHYRVGKLAWHTAGRWVVRARTFTLPNLIHQGLTAGRSHAVPELVPHFGEVEPIVEAMRPLLSPTEARREQLAAFELIHRAYAGPPYTERATNALLEHLPAEAAGAASQHTPISTGSRG